MSDRAEFLESALFCAAGFRHAFFTRAGGISSGAYASLSFSVVAGDDPENVRQNLERDGSALGGAPHKIHFLSQVHGDVTHVLRGDEDQRGLIELEGDALVSAAAG